MAKNKSQDLKNLQKLLRQRSKEEKLRHFQMRKDENALKLSKTEDNTTGVARVVKAMEDFLETQCKLINLVAELEVLIPEEEEERDPKLSDEEGMAMFLIGNRDGDICDSVFAMNPPTIALVALNDFFKDSERFEISDPNSLPFSQNLMAPYESSSPTHTAVQIGSAHLSVPLSAEYWFYDKKLNAKFIVGYKPTNNGSLAVTVFTDFENEQQSVEFITELRKCVLASPYIKGKIIEITGGSDFRVIEIGEQPEPIIDARLRSELEKNVVNIFTKRAEFEKYGLPVKRSVILCGPPGCGKTMIERWLASKVTGEVTTIWVTAKSIQSAEDVASIFDIARKLSPSLVIMEDLDLISGTRSPFGQSGSGPLGEMLNQLDGLTQDQSIVLVGSTNRLGSLDEALADRPGRFDRVYEVGKPTEEIAKIIARNYLVKRGIDPQVVENLALSCLNSGEFTGAQVVEIVKGGIFEAIHRNCDVSDTCIQNSAKGLQDQKKLTKRE